VSHLVLAYYHFTCIDDPAREVERHKDFFKDREITCRIYISKEGINGQLSGEKEDARAYMAWMKSDPRFGDMEFKWQTATEQVFPRATVKVRDQLVALDMPADPKQGGEHVSPAKWKKMLQERDRETLLLDVRNDYEWEIGHFEGAELPPLETFRAFGTYAQRLRQEKDPKKTKVMMYCTGGIRCELYSSLLKQQGFENVYQLEGGVIKYGEKEGSAHWRGKLFVFDDRLAIPLSEDAPEDVISSCRHCDAKSDVYYNCANTDCNDLFLSCPACAETFSGCCSTSCQSAPRLRKYEKGKRPKPFRRKAEVKVP
jgi:UPF0176 protein